MAYRLPSLYSLLLLLAGAAFADAVPAPQSDAVCDAAARVGVPGVAYAVVTADARHVATCGKASPDAAASVTGGTPFEAASLSKTVFAALFVEGLDHGGLQLDSSLASTGVPERVTDEETYAKLTPRLVLSHQSGLPNWSGDARDPDRTDPLEFSQPPGTAYGYSGEGYELLRAHVEAATGRGLEAWFRSRRDALGMPDSSYLGPTDSTQDTVAVGPDGTSSRALSTGDHANAAASLITTADDYAGFLQYLLSHPALLDTLLQPEVTVEMTGDETIYWGLGWGIFKRADGTRIGFHWGDNYQFKSFTAIDPASGRAVAFFANGFEGLRLVDVIVEPVVGDLRVVRDWLGYEDG